MSETVKCPHCGGAIAIIEAIQQPVRESPTWPGLETKIVVDGKAVSKALAVMLDPDTGDCDDHNRIRG